MGLITDLKKTLSSTSELLGNDAASLVKKTEILIEKKITNCLPLIIILLFILALSGIGTMAGVVRLIVR